MNAVSREWRGWGGRGEEWRGLVVPSQQERRETRTREERREKREERKDMLICQHT
jgi:hypothetical protein